jgi:predicted AlkP superfamily phosphohydrolase/phosphomutase
MSAAERPRVLAIGIDAAEPSAVRPMIERGELPALQRLLGTGSWSRVDSPAHIGSGTVWPTFFTGTPPQAHGLYGEWCWEPATMDVRRVSGRHLTPFWRPLIQEGWTVGVLDVPFAPFLGSRTGFEVCEWGAHDMVEGRVDASPAPVSDVVTREVEPHPFAVEVLDASGPGDHGALTTLAAACLRGVRARGALARRLIREVRPELALVVFTEIHHLAHYLWHTLAPEDPLYDTEAFRRARPVTPTLLDLFRGVDEQIGELVAEAPGAQVFVFSLHGMRPARGVTTVLGSVLCETGWARPAGWATQGWDARARTLMAAVKRRTPAALKKVYYRTLPRAATYRLAQQTMLGAYDWAHTRAFALPTDQHGWVRLNLAGREARGVVPLHEYDESCRRLEGMLRALATDDGRPLVRDVIRTASRDRDAQTLRLPDIVVHWEDAALASPLRVKGMGFESHPTGAKYVGQHALDGFLVAPGRRSPGERVSGQDLHRLFTAALGDRSPRS